MPRTAERGGPQTRARIREVANRMFIERGFDSVTVAEVAREAGVSTVTVFNHFATKEDLFLDRVDDAIELLRAAVRERGENVDVIASLRSTTMSLIEDRNPLSGIDPKSLGFFRTVANSPALVSRARAIAAHLQRLLADELRADSSFHGDAILLAAFFISGYSAILVNTAERLLAVPSDADTDAVVDDHRDRFEELFEALRAGVAD